MLVRWLGTATFEIRSAQTVLLIDPYFTRDSLWHLLTHPAKPDLARIEPHLDSIQAVLVGHSHIDHLLDAPTVARRTDAMLFGSEDTLRVARAEGVSESRLQALRHGDAIAIGDLTVEVVGGAHSAMATQWLVSGPMPQEVRMPLGMLDYKCGPVLNFLIHWRGRTLLHCGSAELIESNFTQRHVDVALFCINGWKSDPTVFSRLHRALSPDVIVPMHHDDFFQPLSKGLRVGPLVHEARALEKIRHDVPGSRILPLDFFEAFLLEGTT